MRTIDKRATLFGIEDEDGYPVINIDKRSGFKAGAEWMREELLRWHDPKEELPKEDARVLCEVDECEYTQYLVLNWYEGRWWSYRAYDVDDDYSEDTWKLFHGKVLGWREIHE